MGSHAAATAAIAKAATDVFSKDVSKMGGKAMSQKSKEQPGYRPMQMQKEMIIQRLKERGCRITKQRQMILDIILEEDCSCCKEIYYKALKKDAKIGTATVYRMVNTLEEIGAINRKNMYRVACGEDCKTQDSCTIEFDDDTVFHLSGIKWRQVVTAGLQACGYLEDRTVRSVVVSQCDGEE